VKASASKDDDDDDDDEDNDENDEEEELVKSDEEEESGKGGNEVRESKGESDEKETKEEEEESFDPIPRTPEESEEERNNEEDQDLRLSEEARIQEEEDADELYRDVNINQGRGLQVTQNVEDTHVTLTPVNPDGLQESSSMSSFVSSMLNPISDVGVESIFTTASSPIVSLDTLTPIMTHSTIAKITTSSKAPIPPPTIPSIILENLPTFNSAFRFEERLRSLETFFFEYRQTNPFADAVSAIPENDEFLRNIDENMKKIIKGQIKNQVKEQVSRILPRIEESVNATLEAEVLSQSSHSSRTSYAIAADLSEMELKKILIEKMQGNKSIQRSDEQRNLQKEGSEHASASTPSEKATEGAGRSTIGSQSRQMSVNFFNFIMHRLNVDTLTPDLLAGSTYELMRGSCTSLTELEYHLEEPLPLISNNRGRRVIPFEHFINNDLEYLWGGDSSRKYTTSVTKTKAADYGHIKWIEDLVPHEMWIQQPIDYNKHALWGVSRWGRKRKKFYGYAVNQESARDVYSKRRIIDVTKL
nr:hypothetical protein [Tanacetum cinerariifolium]